MNDITTLNIAWTFVCLGTNGILLACIWKLVKERNHHKRYADKQKKINKDASNTFWSLSATHDLLSSNYSLLQKDFQKLSREIFAYKAKYERKRDAKGRFIKG